MTAVTRYVRNNLKRQLLTVEFLLFQVFIQRRVLQCQKFYSSDHKFWCMLHIQPSGERTASQPSRYIRAVPVERHTPMSGVAPGYFHRGREARGVDFRKIGVRGLPPQKLISF